MARKKWKEIGVVGVDSGQLMICDPCYLDDANGRIGWEKNTDPSFGIGRNDFSYRGVCAVTLGHKEGEPFNGQINYAMGHSGRAVAFPSGYGDGVYTVEAREDEDGRIVEVRIRMG